MSHRIFKSIVFSATIMITVLVSAALLHAQEANYELALQFTSDKIDKMVGNTSVFPRWIEDTNKFWYSYETPDGNFWYYVDAEEGTKRPLFDREVMAAKLTEIFRRPFQFRDLDLEDFEYNTREGFFTFHVDSINFRYNVESRTLIKQDSVKEEPDDSWMTYSPDSTWIAFAKNHNLYLMRADDPDSTEYQLTTNGERWYSYQADESDTTSDERLRSSARWFEDSEKLFTRRVDERKVKELWVIHTLGERPELELYKYAMPGDKYIGKPELWVFNADTVSSTDGVKIDFDKEEWQEEIGGISLGMGSDYLWVMRRNRLYNEVDVLKANTTTGEVELLWTETSKPYLNPRFGDLIVIEDGEEYIWWSDRTGWGQLYRYDSEGNLMNRITEGHYFVGDIVKTDTTAQTLFFEGYGREEGIHPYYAMLYKINFDGSGMERLTPENADHQIFESDEDGNYFVDNYSRVNSIPKSVLRNGDGEVIMELQETDLSRLKAAGWKAPEMFTIKAADGITNLYGVMWKPFDFDSTKTYPIISYVYPGPQTEPFPTDFSVSARQTSLAQIGFIVVAFGNRGGSPIRSKYYHTYGYENLRDYALADNRYGIEQLAARYPFIDMSRVGIYGHSGGGFMSTAAILTYPDFYDAAVSSSGNHDNNVYNKWWSETHNGVKKVTKTIKVDDGEGGKKDSTVVTWEAAVDSNTELAENLKGHLLLTTGTIDSNVHPANTIRMANALIEAGKRFDYMIFPGQRHGYGDYTPYFQRLTWDYFAKHLLNDYPDQVDYIMPEEED